MERLLTEEEIRGLIDGALKLDPVTGMRQGLTNREFVERVANAEHKATLKAVGEWLKKSISLDELWAWEPDIETLLRGEMPEEGK